MEGLKDKTADLVNHAEDLAATFYELTLLKATQKASNLASSLFFLAAAGLLGFLFLVLGGLALSWWLGDVVNSRAGGFLIGAGFIVLLLVILVLLRKKIVFPFVRDLVIRKLYD
jgi:apolipoprotein N-acyltransferase